MRRGLVAIVLVAGCDGTILPGHHTPYLPTLPSGPCAVDGVTGSVPGVTLSIHADDCLLAHGQGATFTYTVTTDASVPPLNVPDDGGGCGSCESRSTDPMSWVGWTIGGTSREGVAQRYCLCDVGCCAPNTAQTIQPTVATETATLEWTGRTWDGPSDTGNQMGDFFEPGIYDVVVGFAGYDAGSVQASLAFEVMP